jgi:hypothetical protein
MEANIVMGVSLGIVDGRIHLGDFFSQLSQKLACRPLGRQPGNRSFNHTARFE